MTRTRANSGFSLIEALVSVTLFAVVAAGMAATTVAATRGNNASKTNSVAAALVHDKIEQLRALDPGANPADLSHGTHADPANPLTATGAVGGTFVRTWTVNRNFPRSGMAFVRVRVAWNSPTPRQVEGITFVCLNGKCS